MTVMKCGLRLAALGAALMAGAALADVKAGADAWSRGDYAAAVRQWEGAAAAGDADAQFNLGQAYRLGRGVNRDLARAEDLFGKAAAQGHVQAADNYGLILFDRGDRAAAMPYVRAAAERGDPRAQYLLGIAHFNGDLAPKDWKRAYALMTLAQGAGLPQAAPALAQMDQFIPLADRQAAAGLAAELAQASETRRSARLAATDLADDRPPVVTAVGPAAPPAVPRVAATPPLVRPEAAVSAAVRTAGTASPALAGADYARPAIVTPPPRAVASAATPAGAAPKPARVAAPAPSAPARPAPAKPVPAKPASSPTARSASGGSWRVQLGAFGVAANADALWARAKARPELAGHPRLDVPAGKVMKLQAGGFASREAANAACAALGKAGLSCIPAQD